MTATHRICSIRCIRSARVVRSGNFVDQQVILLNRLPEPVWETLSATSESVREVVDAVYYAGLTYLATSRCLHIPECDAKPPIHEPAAMLPWQFESLVHSSSSQRSESRPGFDPSQFTNQVTDAGVPQTFADLGAVQVSALGLGPGSANSSLSLRLSL
jgi:hypothetical protein